MKKIVGVVDRVIQSAKSTLTPGKQSDIAEQAPPFSEVTPSGELLGCLDAPTTHEVNLNGTLTVVGWLCSRNTPIQSLLLAKDDAAEEPITYGLPRPDVAQVFPDIPNAALSGFRWNIFLGKEFSGNLTLKMWVVLENGEKFCCFARLVSLQPSPTTEVKSISPYLFIYGAAKKAIAAFQHGRLPLSPLQWVRKLRRYYQQLKSNPAVTLENYNIVHTWELQDSYQRWWEINRLSPRLLSIMTADAAKIQEIGPKISVVVPLYNTPPLFLQEMIESVTNQVYPNWELCLADDASTVPDVKEIIQQYAAKDARIKVTFRVENGHISAATNSAIELATGEYIALLDHDDLLTPDALLQVAECIVKNPDADWIYTDEDKIDENGRHYDPQMKGAWSPEMMLTHNYTQHFTVIRKSLVSKVGGMRRGFEGAQDLDLYLRVNEQTTDARIHHIPKVCYHWRCHSESTASSGTQKSYVFDSALKAITEAVARRGLKATPFLPALAQKRGLCLYQLKWDSSLLAQNPVTIVIPTKDKAELLEKCINSLERTVDKRYVKLIIVDDGSQEVKTHNYFHKLQQNKVFDCRVIPSGRTDAPFNYARLMNLGAKYVKTPLMLQLNNDIEAIAPGWLEDMVGWMSISGVGIVGAKLLYPDQTIQHAGVVIGPHNGLADHQFHLLPKEEVGYICLPHAARNVSAVTGACLLTSTSLYRELRGFDEENFSVQYNDVDYCLRVMASGKRIVYTPQATLIHLTSASRGKDYNYKEHLNFITKYHHFQDPFFNQSIDIDSMWMAINPYHYCHTARLEKLKVLIVSHNLNLEGAPLIVYSYAKHFATAGGYQIQVISAEDGVLRDAYEELNIPVKIVKKQLPRPEEKIEHFRSRLKKLGESIDLASFDLVVCNTLVCFWGVELARLFGLPSIWHIHESTPLEKSIKSFFGEACEESMPKLLKDCFLNASRVVFQASTTRRIFQPWNVKDNFRNIPGAIAIQNIDDFRQTHSKAALRAKYGIGENDLVLTVVGTICERKGQHIFIEAIKELEAKYTRENKPNFTYLIVGGNVVSYLRYIEHQIQKLELQNVKIYHETKDVYDFFCLSDIFVCSSFEESFPRVILEAMAFELKIVSTNVFGIVEMIDDGVEGYLVEAGNPQALAEAIYKCLSEPKIAARLASNAYATVNRKFNLPEQLEKHLLLTKESVLSVVNQGEGG